MEKMERIWKVHNEFHNLFSAPNIVRMVKSQRVRWAGV
jgi:hypothetical protein